MNSATWRLYPGRKSLLALPRMSACWQLCRLFSGLRVAMTWTARSSKRSLRISAPSIVQTESQMNNKDAVWEAVEAFRAEHLTGDLARIPVDVFSLTELVLKLDVIP